MAVTEDDLQKQREKLDKLRDQIAETNAQREERERDASREIEMAQMKAEEARLQAELSLSKEMAKASAVKAGAGDLLETVKDREAVANEQAKAAAKPAGKE